MRGHVTIAVVKNGFIVSGEFEPGEGRDFLKCIDDRSIHQTLDDAFKEVENRYEKAWKIQILNEGE